MVHIHLDTRGNDPSELPIWRTEDTPKDYSSGIPEGTNLQSYPKATSITKYVQSAYMTEPTFKFIANLK